MPTLLMTEWVKEETERLASVATRPDESMTGDEAARALSLISLHVKDFLRDALAEAESIVAAGIAGHEARRRYGYMLRACEAWLIAGRIAQRQLAAHSVLDLRPRLDQAITEVEQWQAQTEAFSKSFALPNLDELNARRADFEKQHPPTGRSRGTKDVLADRAARRAARKTDQPEG